LQSLLTFKTKIIMTDWKDTMEGPQILEDAYDMIGFAYEEMLGRAHQGCEIKEIGLFVGFPFLGHLKVR
jgi:hypothetical protein